MKTCPNCGAEIETDSKFCRNCGLELQGGNQTAENKTDSVNMSESVAISPEPAATKKSHRKALIAAISAGILVIVGVIVAFSLLSAKPLKVEGNLFAMTVDEFKERYNSHISEAVGRIGTFDEDLVTGDYTYTTQIGHDVEICLWGEGYTKDYFRAISLYVNGANSIGDLDTFKNYAECVLLTCDPTVSQKDREEFISIITGFEWASGKASKASTGYYSKNGMTYTADYEIGSYEPNRFTLYVFPRED